jgi:hypothetical protein
VRAPYGCATQSAEKFRYCVFNCNFVGAAAWDAGLKPMAQLLERRP